MPTVSYPGIGTHCRLLCPVAGVGRRRAPRERDAAVVAGGRGGGGGDRGALAAAATAIVAREIAEGGHAGRGRSKQGRSKHSWQLIQKRSRYTIQIQTGKVFKIPKLQIFLVIYRSKF